MRIGVDIDEVLASYMDAFILFHNEKYNTSLVRSDFKQYNISHILGISYEEDVNRAYEFFETDYFRNIETIEGSEKGLKQLKKYHELIIVTGRQFYIEQETRNWLDTHFPNTFSEIYLANAYSKNGGKKKKSELCNRAGIDLLIEDNLDNALECVRPNRRVILMDQFWNQTPEDIPNIQRVNHWDQIPAHV